MITVALVRVQGNVDYPVSYVRRLASVVRRLLPVEHRIVVLTDRPQDVLLEDCVTAVRIRAPQSVPGWWAKMELFNPDNGLTGRVMYLDLDTLPVSDLTPVANYDAPFALVPDEGNWQGRNGLKVVKRYNSSVMVWDDRARPRLYDLWNKFVPSVTRRLWGDQDFIGEQMPNESVMPVMWFPRLSAVVDGMNMTKDVDAFTQAEAQTYLSDRAAKVVLSKKPKNLDAAKMLPWFDKMWR